MSETRRPTPEDPFNQFRFIMWDKRRTYLEEINKPVDEMSDVLALKRVVQLLLPFNQDYAVIELRKLEGLPEYSEELLDKDEPMEVYTQRIERMNIELPWFSALASLESELSDVLIKFENEGQLPPQIKFLETLHNKKIINDLFDNYQLTQHHGLTSRVLAASVLLYTDYSIMLNDPEIQSNWKLSVYERTHQHRNAYRESLEQTSKYYLQLTGQDPALFDRIFSRIK